jgi:hypothetical protein
MATCKNGECPELDKIHDSYEKTHEAIIKQTTTLEMFMGVVERDRDERREAEKEIFKQVKENAVALERKADKDKTISKSGATILISVLALVFTIIGVSVAVFG